MGGCWGGWGWDVCNAGGVGVMLGWVGWYACNDGGVGVMLG